MEDKTPGFVTSILSGFTPGATPWITVTRSLVISFLILIHAIPICVDFNLIQCILFAFGLSISILFTKALIYYLNSLVNRSFEIDESSSDIGTSQVQEQEDMQVPDGIPTKLWEMRGKFSATDQITEQMFSDLLSKGFDTNSIMLFFRFVRNPSFYNSISSSKEPIKNRREYIRMCGCVCKLPFSRITLNALFPGNDSLKYLFFLFIFCFSQCTFVPMIMSYVTIWEKLLYALYSGASLYSLLSPPEVDPYSTTKGDIMTGITRPFSITILCSLYILFAYLYENGTENTYVNELIITIEWRKILYVLCGTCRVCFDLFPLVLLILISHPATFLTWLLEWISRYLFGLSGTTGLLHAIFQTLRSTAVMFVCYALIHNNTALKLSAAMGVALFILQIPLTVTTILKEKLISRLLITAGTSVICFISCYCSATMAYLSFDAIIGMSVTCCFLFDIVWPYINAHSFYVLFYTRIINLPNRTINVLRNLTPCLFVPLVLGSILTKYPINPWITAIMIVSALNISICEPHMWAFSLIIDKITLFTEFGMPNASINLFIGLMLSRKIRSIMPTMDYWRRGRLAGLYYLYDTYYSDSIAAKVKDFIITQATILLPGPDTVLSTPGFLWSLITGAPFHSPQNFSLIMLPCAPRPNCFWDTSQSRTDDISKPFIVSLTEHPVEAPVYSSLSRALVKSLASMVKSGSLGIIESNDFLLFLSEPLAAFVHIIALEPSCVRFQLRGLEYNDETLCHLGEIARLKDDVASYQDRIPNILSMMTYAGTDWTTRAKNMPIMQYNVTTISASRAFLGIDKSDIEKWGALVFCTILDGKNSIIISQQPGELNKTLVDVIKGNNLKVDNARASSAFATLLGLTLTNGVPDGAKLMEFFSQVSASTDILYISLYTPAARLFALILAVVSMGIAPETTDLEECNEFIKEVQESFLPAPITSPEFSTAFKRETKDIFSITERGKEITVLFFRLTEVQYDIMHIQRAFVRSFWASEAFLQVFFGEDNEERLSIQEDDHMLHNLILQACDLPIGYPAMVSPILSSYLTPDDELFLDR